MNRIKRGLYFTKIFFLDHVGIILMMMFHIVASSLFFFTFFSVGINVYKEVIRMSGDIDRDEIVNVCFYDDSEGSNLLKAVEELTDGEYSVSKGEGGDGVNRLFLSKEAYERLGGKIDLSGFFVVEGNDNVEKISGVVKMIRFIICVFGLIFTVLTSVHIVDLFDLLIERNIGKLYMLSALGYYENDMKTVVAIFSLFMAFIGSLLGAGVFFIVGIIAERFYSGLSLFGISVTSMTQFSGTVLFLCPVILSLCILGYEFVGFKRLNGENLVIGLKGMVE